jgi:isopenicillin-N epimerase
MIPLDLAQLGCDYYGGNCHKWLLAPSGAGFLFFGPGAEERMQPLQVSWGWHYDRSQPDKRDEFGSTPRLRAYEFEGTRDLCPWLAVPEAIDFQASLGWENTRGRFRELAGYARQRIGRGLGLPLATPEHPDLHGSMTAFRLPQGTEAARLQQEFWARYRIEVPIIERPSGLLIRVSTHFYNTEAEIEHLELALRELLPL